MTTPTTLITTAIPFVNAQPHLGFAYELVLADVANYLSVVGLDGWRGAIERTHVIGKGINRFHAVYWLAFLLAAELPLPDRILVHGYLTVDGHKISKSLRPAPVPPAVDELGVDPLRWYFARHCRTRVDTDVTYDSVIAAYNRDLVDGLGNLVQRCSVLAGKLGVPVPEASPGEPLGPLAAALRGRVDAALDAFLLDDACSAIVELVDAANKQLEVTAPWRVARTDAATAAALLAQPLAVARVVARELAPFVPGVSRLVAERLHGTPGAGEPPLPRRTRGQSRTGGTKPCTT